MRYDVEFIGGRIGLQVSLAPFVSFGLTVLTLWVLLRANVGMLMDEPNHRSLHFLPVPKIGGIGLLAGVLAGWGLVPTIPLSLFFSVGVLGAFSFLDDKFNLPVRLRLPVHLFVSGAWLLGTGSLELLPLLLLIILFGWMTNLFNFMDGANGLAGGMAAIGFGVYGFAAWQAGDVTLALMAWVVTAAAFGFLLFNFDPARVFLGDTGSIPLGFLSAAIGFVGWQHEIWPEWFPLLVFSPFIFDATVTLAARIFRGEKFWHAHREHLYQRLILSGWSHRHLSLLAYVLMLACGGSGLSLLNRGAEVAILGLVAWGLIYATLLLAINASWRRFQGGHR